MDRFQIYKAKALRILIVLAVFAVCLVVLKVQPWKISGKNSPPASPQDITIPSIINGNLVIPKLSTSSGTPPTLFGGQGLGVVSANLFPIFDQQTQKLTGIRIIGELSNPSEKNVNDISPIIKFYNADNKLLGQKIAQLSSGFTFPGVGLKQSTVYDVTVPDPPTSDKVEIIINAASTAETLSFEPLLIASRSMEIKTATYQGNTQTASGSSATESASQTGQKVEYYSVSGNVVNGLDAPVTDILVYAWMKDKDNKIFSFAKQEFKNDLVQSQDKLDFKLLLLPLKDGAQYESYELIAVGKRYKLNL